VTSPRDEALDGLVAAEGVLFDATLHLIAVLRASGCATFQDAYEMLKNESDFGPDDMDRLSRAWEMWPNG
jgi:hypothetical protein